MDYRAEARRLGAPPVPIVDGHAHINGAKAAALYARVMDLFGVERVYSQSQLAEAADIKAVLGDRIRFVAVPEYMAQDKAHAFRQGFLDNVEVWANEFGARMVKFWNAPRFRDFAAELGLGDDLIEFDSPWRVRVAERAAELGMMFMVHVADPDTWFATKYSDAKRYKLKRDHYAPLERFMARFPGHPLLAAHMAGYPEDLAFLADFMERHPNVVVDTSATKWMIRELSKHPRDELLAFLERFGSRVIFGSDLVTLDAHLEPSPEADKRFGAQLADSEAAAFDLYASRYWALRTMYETNYQGESNIADPDLMMVDPERYDEMSAPPLAGRALPKDTLTTLYRGAVANTLDAWYGSH